jgi:iron(III) transport system permease protein
VQASVGVRKAAAGDRPRPPRAGRLQRLAPAWQALGDNAALLPLIAVTAFLTLVPVIYVLIGATNGRALGEGYEFSLRALERAYTSADSLRPLWNSIAVGAAVTICSVSLGTLFAWIIGRTDVPGRSFFEFVIVMPNFLSPFAMAIAWVNLAAPRAGYLNLLVNSLVPADTRVVLFDVFSVAGIIWCMVLFFTPVAFLLMLAPFRSMDPALEEAAGACGASTSDTIRHVTIPVLRPAVLAAGLYVLILATEMFSIPGYLGSGIKFFTLPYNIYLTTSRYPIDHALAAASATLIMLLAFVGLYLYRRSTAASRRFVTVTGRGYRPTRMSLGRLRYAAAALCAAYGIVAVVLPLVALAISGLLRFTSPTIRWDLMSFQNVAAVLAAPLVQRSIGNTLLLAGVVAPLGAIILGVAVAYVIHRTNIPARGVVDYIASLPMAVPGIVFATGLLWAYVGTPIYASLAILAIAYISHYIPYANRSIGSTLMQVDRDLEEAARVCGASTLRSLWWITVPLIRPTVMATWVFLFLAVVRESSASILLASPNSIVLSVVSWNYMFDGQFNQASVVALLQTAIILAVLLFTRLVLRVQPGPSDGA